MRSPKAKKVLIYSIITLLILVGNYFLIKRLVSRTPFKLPAFINRALGIAEWENLGPIFDNHGFPSTALRGNLLYDGGRDPYNETAGVFVVYELNQKKVIFTGLADNRARNMMVDKDGNAFIARNGNGLAKYDAKTNTLVTLKNSSGQDVVFPWFGRLRASTRQASNGWIYGATDTTKELKDLNGGIETNKLFKFNPQTYEIVELADAWDYTASVALDPAERYMYYIPGAHGKSWEMGTPVLQFDVETKQHKVIAFLKDFFVVNKGYTLGGTYGLTLDKEGKRLFVSMNASKAGDKTAGFGSPVVLVIHIPDSEIARVETPRIEKNQVGFLGYIKRFVKDVAAQNSSNLSFSDVSSVSGLSALLKDPGDDAYLHSAGWGDVNGDGRPDLFTGAFGGALKNKILLNTSSGFVNSGQTAVEKEARTSGSVFADLDNDSDLDLVVSNNKIENPNTARKSEPNGVYRNDSGTFVDVSTQSGIQVADLRNRAVGVLDYNNDGKLDLFIVADFFGTGVASSHLFKNNGSLQFSDVTSQAGLSGIKSLGIAVGDLNGDGWPDIFLAGGPTLTTQTNYLFVNNKDGTFRRADNNFFAWQSNGEEDWVSGAALGDVNRDGKLDLVVTHHFGSSENQGIAVSPKLYLNRTNFSGSSNPDPVFEEVTSVAGLTGFVSKAPHAEIQDFDNDAWPDIYLSIKNGADQPWIYKHNGTLDSLARPSFVAPANQGLTYYPGGPVADYDRDGKLDVFFEEFRADTLNPVWLLKNNTAGGNWLDVKVSTSQNSIGIGAKVSVYKAGTEQLLGFNEISVGNGYSSSGPALVHFGLGSESSVDVKVQMPFGGQIFESKGVAANQMITLGGGTGGGGTSPTPTPGQCNIQESAAFQGLVSTAETFTSSSFLAVPSIAPPTAYTVAKTAPTVDFAPYPLANYIPDLWSQWGQTLFASNGIFYSAVGDEMAPNGNTFLYQYNPSTKELKALYDTKTATNHVVGSWGHGKIHAGIHEYQNYIYSLTYWGSDNNVVFNENYKGSVLLRFPISCISQPVPTNTPAPTSGASPTPTKTPTPTSIISLTPTPTPRVGGGTPSPTNTPVPTIRTTTIPTPTSILTQPPTATTQPTQPPTGDTINLALTLRLSFQGITRKTPTDKMTVKVTLVGGPQRNEKTAEFIVDDQGIWTGTLSFNNLEKRGDYSILVKGPKHIQKRICASVPQENVPGTYSCFLGQISIQTSNLTLDFSKVKLLAGDLPQQDGIVDSYDLSLVRNIIVEPLAERTSAANTQIADINLDRIVDSQDFSLLIAALSIRPDEN